MYITREYHNFTKDTGKFQQVQLSGLSIHTIMQTWSRSNSYFLIVSCVYKYIDAEKYDIIW